jgi:hypothetical protein
MMPLCSTIFGLGVCGIPFCALANLPFGTRSYSRTWISRVRCHNLVLLNIRCTFSQLGNGNECRRAVVDSFFYSNWTLFDAQYKERYAAD